MTLGMELSLGLGPKMTLGMGLSLGLGPKMTLGMGPPSGWASNFPHSDRLLLPLCPISLSLLRRNPCQEDHLPELLRPGMLRIGEDGRPLDEPRLL